MEQHSGTLVVEESGVASVERAIAIMRAFAPEDRGLELAQIADRSGLHKSTILRLLQTLLRHRFVVRSGDNRYALGPALLQLGAIYQANHDVADVLIPVMRGLAASTGESVTYYVPDGDMRVCAHRIESHHPLRYIVRLGDSLPLGVGSGGRVLAALQRMWHAAFGERDPDVSGLAAPVFGRGNALVGTIIVAGPSVRVTQAFAKRMCRPLLEAAAEVTAGLGGDPDALLQAARRSGEL
jgi:DNA-binding IclR family transcriptional regulator